MEAGQPGGTPISPIVGSVRLRGVSGLSRFADAWRGPPGGLQTAVLSEQRGGVQNLKAAPFDGTRLAEVVY